MKLLLSLLLLFSTSLYSNETDFFVVEGDIAIRKSTDKAAPNRVSRKWKNGVIPWEISSRDRNKTALIKAVKRGIKLLSEKTNLVFKKRSSKDRDFVSFTSRHKGCFSYIGRQGGRQEINLARGCHGTITVAHEIFHASGIEHEQSREDRDSYININWNNVASSHKHNFNKVRGARHGEYNYKSIMHYGSYAFSSNRSPTMITKNGKTIRQNREYLTRGDIAGVNYIYPEKFTEFKLNQLDLNIKKLSGGKVSLSLKAGPRNLKLLKFVQYFMENNNSDSPKLKNWDKNFKYTFRPIKGKNWILAEFNLNNNEKLDKEFVYYYLDKDISTSCTFTAKNKTKTFTVPLSYEGKRPNYKNLSLNDRDARVSAVYDFEKEVVRLNLSVKRKKGLMRKEIKDQKEFKFSKSGSAKVSIKKATLSCRLKVSSI